ncbi:hypothetical protein [Prevotella pallens]|uniref:hypothetical protein n=1 Tax=Prevotella pallens TaxID=60133 RepID=UPI001CAB0155|nr:hypothetical protein [Prevotella pallens]MBF1463434.1 hypothetical protein [Prevotella pallens]
MNLKEIAKEMARDGYNPKDDEVNNRALQEYLQTQAGLENTHDKVREAAEDPDDKYYLELSKNLGTLYVMSNDDYSVVEAYDLWAIQSELEEHGDWVEADYWEIRDVVR